MRVNVSNMHFESFSFSCVWRRRGGGGYWHKFCDILPHTLHNQWLVDALLVRLSFHLDDLVVSYVHGIFFRYFVSAIKFSPWRPCRFLYARNIFNPVCCVATVFLQVRCMYWGHLGLFHWDTSPLNWYKMVSDAGITYTFIRLRYTNIYILDYLQSVVLRYFHWRFIALAICVCLLLQCVLVCVSTLQRPPGERYPCFILFLPLSDLCYLIGPWLVDFLLEHIIIIWFDLGRVTFIKFLVLPNTLSNKHRLKTNANK